MKNRKHILIRILFVVLSGSFLGCNNDVDPFDFEAQRVKEVKAIDDFLAANGITAIKDKYSGVSIVIKKLGKGLPAQQIATLDATYKGYLFSDGSVFDEGVANLPLLNYINGWRIAFAQLPAGSEATLYIPSLYAYGNSASDKIPANSTLVFDVNFKKVLYSSTFNSQLKTDTLAIATYLNQKGITALRDTTGVYYVMNSVGTGPSPTLYDKLKLTYSIKLLSDDSKNVVTVTREPTEDSDNRSVDFVQGLIVALLKMKEGGKATFYIPSGLAFGTTGGYVNNTQIVPPNQTIIVDVELTDVL